MYIQKYLKYKTKYLRLMNQIGGKTNCDLNTITQNNNNYNLNCIFSQPIDKSIIQKNDNNIKCDCTSPDTINWNCNCNKKFEQDYNEFIETKLTVDEYIEKCYNLHKQIRLKMTEIYKKNIRSCPKLDHRTNFEPYISEYIEAYNKIPEDEDWWNKNISCNTNKQRETIDCFNKQLIKEFPEFKKSSCSKNALDNENNFIDEFNKNNNFKKNTLNKLDIYETNDEEYYKYIAVKPTKAKTTKNWSNYKEGTGEKTSKPKTDIVIKKDDTIIKKISLKSGSGRITSSDFYETYALFQSVYLNKYKDNDKLEEIIKILFENFDKEKYKINDKNITFDKLKHIYKNKIYLDNTTYTKHIEWYTKKINEYEILNKIWHELREEHSDFCMDIIKEAFQGKLKFDNNIGEADTLINLEGCTTNIVSIIDFSNTKEFNAYVKKMFESTVLKGNVFRTKSSSNDTKRTLWTRFL